MTNLQTRQGDYRARDDVSISKPVRMVSRFNGGLICGNNRQTRVPCLSVISCLLVSSVLAVDMIQDPDAAGDLGDGQHKAILRKRKTYSDNGVGDHLAGVVE